MNINMDILGLKGVLIEKCEQLQERIILHVSMPKREHSCPSCGLKTSKVHDYRLQKIKHLKWFERLTILFYKRRRYACVCGKRFSETSPFVERYQRFSKECNQVMRIRAVKAKTFKEAAETIGASSTTVIRRFKGLVQALPPGVKLPKAIAIDEYKADTDAGKYQLIIADAETHQPIDILPNRRHETLNIHWAIDEVRRKVQKDWHPYDRKKAKRMRHVLHKDEAKLTEQERWYLKRYTSMSSELKEAHELKEFYKAWQRTSKKEKDISVVMAGLEVFYRKVEETGNTAFLKAIKTFKNWQVEILNSYVFGYSNGFLEGINNTSKVIKRNAYGFRKYEHFKAKVLLNRVYKNVGIHLG